MATKTSSVTVGTSPTRLDVQTDADYRADQAISYYNDGASTVYLGGSDVTTATGVPLPAGAYADEVLLSGSTSYGVVATGTCAVRVKQVGV